MTGLVVDASVVFGWFLPSQASNVSEAALRAARTVVVTAPAHRTVELAGGLRRLERRGLVSPELVDVYLARLVRSGVVIDARDSLYVSQSWLGLARRHNISVPDAAYLELALHHGYRLATNDQALARAAANESVSFTE